MSAVPLTLSSYTLGTTIPFPERVRAAAEAGFAGLGLRAENYVDARRDGWRDADLLRLLDDHGVAVTEVEYVTGWGRDEDRTPNQREKERTVFHMAQLFGVGHVNVGLLEKVPPQAVTRALRALAERAGDLTLAVEFMPYSGIPDLGTAWDVVRACPTAALLVDTWHWARAATTPADLDGIPPERIVSVQLCDVRAKALPEARQESLHHRLPPGRGHGDTIGMVRALRERGAAPTVVAVEVMSDALLSGGAMATAQAVMAAAREVLAAAA